MTLPEYNDLAGRPVPRGRSIRSHCYSALTGPLPNWLATQGAISLAGGALHLSGPAGTLALRTMPVDLAALEVLAFTVENVAADWYSELTVGLGLKDDAGTCGAAIFQPSVGQPTAVLRLVGAGQPDIPIRYLWAGPNMLRHRNLTIAIGVADRSVWLMESDQVMHYGVYPRLRLGAVRGVLDASVSAPSGQTRELRTTQVRLTAESL